jgi:uncharacterized membrane protein YhaH (DUF805 family)
MRATRKYLVLRGRDSWGQFWGFLFQIQIVILVFLFGLDALEAYPVPSALVFWLAMIFGVAIIPAVISACVRRLHDLGLPGWTVVLVPVLWFVLLFPGSRKPNRYGMDPRHSWPIATIEELDAMKRADLYHEFAVDVTPVELLRGYSAPDPLDGLTAAVLDTGWATETTARPIARGLWQYALDSAAPDELLVAFDAKLDWRASEGLWCLHSVDREGNAWETDDYEADSERAALEAAAEYLAYHEGYAALAVACNGGASLLSRPFSGGKTAGD